MLGLGDLKQTKFYQEAFAEGEEIGEQKTKVEAVSGIIRLGLSRQWGFEL